VLPGRVTAAIAFDAHCCDYSAEEMKGGGLAAAVRGETAAKRDRLPKLFTKLGENPAHAKIVAMNRSLNPLSWLSDFKQLHRGIHVYLLFRED
jgi:phage-related minor tail protein